VISVNRAENGIFPKEKQAFAMVLFTTCFVLDILFGMRNVKQVEL
jgi:hypothetical protein